MTAHRSPLFFALFALGARAACLPASPAQPAEPQTMVLGVKPSEDVGSADTVAVSVSAPLVFSGGEWPIRVTGDQGQQLQIMPSLGAGGTEIRLAPGAFGWPTGQRIRIEIGEGLRDLRGRPLMAMDQPLRFETRPEPPLPKTIAVRYPPQGRRAPLNLKWLALVASDASVEPGELALERASQQVPVQISRRGGAGVFLAQLPSYRGLCDPLCPGENYALRAGSGVEVNAQIQTATIADLIPPIVTSTRVHYQGDRITLEVEASEPVLLTATAVDPGGGGAPIPLAIVPSACVYVEPGPEQLEPDTDYRLLISGEDIAGNLLAPFEVVVRALPVIRVSLSEVVPAPFHDWNDSEGDGDPFDARPGSGAITESDEWIELVNESTFPLDLDTAGLIVQVHDTSPTETALLGATQMHFGDGGSRSSWWPGEALVLRPRGSIAQRAFTIEIYSGSNLLDRVVVGATPDAVSPDGSPPDLVHEALARDAYGNFRWCVATPGDPLPAEECQ